MLLIFDMDTPVYKAAGAVQHRDKETGVLEYEPLSHALSNAKRIVVTILEHFQNPKYVMYLTESHDKTCFRTKIYPKYKANRQRCKRPKYYKEVREYYTKEWGAKTVSEIEADDAVAMAQWKAYKGRFPDWELTKTDWEETDFPSCIIGIDKDLDQIPGLHYNYDKNMLYYITPLQGLKNLYTQILCGDVADNIPRIKKYWKSAEADKKIAKALTESDLCSIITKEIELLSLNVEQEFNWRKDVLTLRTE